MELNEFGLSRDLLYLTGILTGLALGFAITLFTKKYTARSRNRRIVLILLFLSFMLASLAVSVIVSGGGIFAETGVLVLAGIFVLLCAAAVYFPRAAACPLILLAGLFAVWTAYSCLRFPALSNEPLALISPAADNSAAVKIFPAAENSIVYSADGKITDITISVMLIELDKIIPLAGGSGRIALREINAGGKSLFADDPLKSSALGFYYNRLVQGSGVSVPGVTAQNLSGSFSLEEIARGTEMPVFVSELTAAQN